MHILEIRTNFCSHVCILLYAYILGHLLHKCTLNYTCIRMVSDIYIEFVDFSVHCVLPILFMIHDMFIFYSTFSHIECETLVSTWSMDDINHSLG